MKEGRKEALFMVRNAYHLVQVRYKMFSKGLKKYLVS